MKIQSRFFYGYVIVAVTFLVFMVILGLVSSFGIFFKPLLEEMRWSRAATSGAFSINVMVGGVSGIFIGMLNDKFGSRIVLPLCGLFCTIGYLLVSQMNSVWQFYLYFGLIVGIGSNVYVSALSTVARWFVKRRSLMSGISFAGAGFGMLIFPPVINRFLASYNWHISLICLSIIILIVTVLSAILLRKDPADIGQKPYGTDTEEGCQHFDNRSFSLKEALSSKQFRLLFLTFLCYGFCYFSLQVHIAPYATDMGISSSGAALILAVIGGATIAGQIGLGSVGDRFGYKRTFLGGLICIVLSMLTIMLFNGLLAFIIFGALLGLAYGNCSTQETSIVAWLFGLDSHGIILGILAFGFTIGASIGPVLFGYIFDITGSYQYAFFTSVIISLVAVSLTLFIKQSVPDGAKNSI